MVEHRIFRPECNQNFGADLVLVFRNGANSHAAAIDLVFMALMAFDDAAQLVVVADEVRDKGVGRALVDVIRRRDLLDLAMGEDGDPVDMVSASD
jgi:hypothetical protein